MDLNLNPHERRLVDTAREFTREIVVPNAEQWELARKVPIDAIRAAASAASEAVAAFSARGVRIP